MQIENFQFMIILNAIGKNLRRFSPIIFKEKQVLLPVLPFYITWIVYREVNVTLVYINIFEGKPEIFPF